MNLTAGDGPGSVAVGDFDGDADADLAVTNYESGDVSVLLNTTGSGAGGAVPDPPSGGAPPAGPAAAAEPSISRLRLGSRCLRRSRSGRVRVPLSMRLSRPARLEIRISRATRIKGRRSCRRVRRPGANTRFRLVKTIRRTPAPAAVTRLTLKVRLTAGLYRLSVRAQQDDGQMSAPIHRYLHVVG
jgi:hypothetical protein